MIIIFIQIQYQNELQFVKTKQKKLQKENKVRRHKQNGVIVAMDKQIGFAIVFCSHPHNLVLYMLDLQQEESIRARITHLKTYLHGIQQQIQNRGKQKSPYSHMFTSSRTYPTIITQQQRQSSSKRDILKQKIEKLRKQIKTKTELLCGIGSKTHKILHDTNKSIPTTVRVYKSRLTTLESLQRLVKLLANSDWQCSGIYTNIQSLTIVGSYTLQAHRINFEQILCQSIQLHKNYIKFLVNQHDTKTYILQFKHLDQAKLWSKFLLYANQNIRIKNKNLKQKWEGTKVLCTQPKQLQNFRKKQLSFFTNKGNISSEDEQRIKNNSTHTTNALPQKRSRKLSKNTEMKFSLPTSSIFKVRKISIKESQMQRSDSFVISNSSEGKNYYKIDMIKIKQQQLVESIRFETVKPEQKQNDYKSTQKMRKSLFLSGQSEIKQTVKNEYSPKSKGRDELQMTMKVLNKLQQKKKLLAESSLTRLNIHWHEDTEEKPQLVLPSSRSGHQSSMSDSPEKQKQLTQSKQIKLFGGINSISINIKKTQQSTKRDSSESPTRYRRFQSATQNKSNSRQEESQIQQNKRKKTDYSLQNQSERRRSKIQIRDHYLQRLIQKQTIKEMSKSSSKEDNSSSRKQTNTLIPIPEKQTPSASRYGSYRMDGEVSIQESDTNTLDSKQSTEQQIQAQQLKNGIVLEKCSKNSWGTKEKKLYISSTMSQLCYCDIQNPQEEKRFFLRDVKSIQYGKYQRGILKHKKRYDQSRCLLIRINKQGKQKVLEFYLQDSQPVYNLQQFAKKLKDFIQRQGQRQQNSED